MKKDKKMKQKVFCLYISFFRSFKLGKNFEYFEEILQTYLDCHPCYNEENCHHLVDEDVLLLSFFFNSFLL
jgi:hypothetical protein